MRQCDRAERHRVSAAVTLVRYSCSRTARLAHKRDDHTGTIQHTLQRVEPAHEVITLAGLYGSVHAGTLVADLGSWITERKRALILNVNMLKY